MIHSFNYWNNISILISFLLFVSFFPYIVIASQLYPYVLPKCCEPDGIAKVFDGRPISSCGVESSKVVFLPKELFPMMSADVDEVEVELQNSADGLQCDDGPENSDILIDLTNLQATTVTIGRKKAFSDVAFSGDNLLANNGKIYNPRHFCIASRDTKPTSLTIRTCKQACSPQSPCIRRCCGGHQSVLTSTPTSANQSFLNLCSSPTLRRKSWNPWTSTVVRINNETRFYQTNYAPGVDGHLFPQGNCRLLGFTETPLKLLEDGRLQVTLENKTEVLENFCIDGNNGLAVRSPPESLGESGDKCEASEEKEIVVAYVCFPEEPPPPTPTPSPDDNDTISLPACPCLTSQPNQPIELPTRFHLNRTERVRHPRVKLTPQRNGESLECPFGYEDFTVEYTNFSKQLGLMDGLLLLMLKSHSFINQKEFCIRSVFDNALTVRTCKEERRVGSDWWHYLSLIVQFVMFCLIFLSTLFYVIIAVVYILRKDKELILRCGTVCYSISMAVFYVLLICYVTFRVLIGGPDSLPVTFFTIDLLRAFTNRYTFAWMCALCFDFWLTITFLSPGNKSVKLLWGYVAFTLIIPAVFCIIGVIRSRRLIDPEGVSSILLDYMLQGLGYGLPGINFILFLATAVKLWIAQHSSDFNQKKKLFLFYSKLLLLVVLDSVIEFLFLSVFEPQNRNSIHFGVFLLCLMLFHPIVSFFLLVWNEETKRFLEINQPRVKKTLDFIAGIEYPVRKCWEMRRHCKRHQEVGTIDDETLATFIISADSHAETSQDSGIAT